LCKRALKILFTRITRFKIDHFLRFSQKYGIFLKKLFLKSKMMFVFDLLISKIFLSKIEEKLFVPSILLKCRPNAKFFVLSRSASVHTRPGYNGAKRRVQHTWCCFLWVFCGYKFKLLAHSSSNIVNRYNTNNKFPLFRKHRVVFVDDESEKLRNFVNLHTRQLPLTLPHNSFFEKSSTTAYASPVQFIYPGYSPIAGPTDCYGFSG